MLQEGRAPLQLPILGNPSLLLPFHEKNDESWSHPVIFRQNIEVKSYYLQVDIFSNVHNQCFRLLLFHN